MRRTIGSCAIVGLAIVIGIGPAAAQDHAQGLNALTAAEKAAGWRLLFDGRTANGWRGYMQEEMPEGWQAVDGALTRVGRAGDIITAESYRSFELSLEWKVGPGGNSGVFYRALEGPEAIYMVAPEMQVLDDAGHRDGQSPLTSAGSNFGLHAAQRGVVRPAGQWNEARIIVDGDHVEHWLNGVKLVDYELGSPDWAELVADSKFVEWPEYGTATEGHIGLQDHGDWAAFRNIKIRPLG